MPIAKHDSAPPWLLLMFSLPTKRASQRVHVWRQLQQFGALSLGHTGYLLPNSATNRERFEWLATEIRGFGGEASVAQVQSINNLSHAQLAGRFAEARARDYQILIRELHHVKSVRSTERPRVRVRQLHQRFDELAAIDFFHSPLRDRAEELLEAVQAPGESPTARVELEKVSRQDYRGRVWVTRPRPGVDRVCSAWLIRRFLDPNARFVFVPEGHVPPKGVPFDMYRGGFGHRGEDCTFETLQKIFRIRDRRVGILAQIVHDADLGDEKFGRREGFGLDRILIGWTKQGLPDAEILARGLQLVEGLYHSLTG